MTLYTVSNGTQSNATDLNQLVFILQQPSGGSEAGKYWLGGSSYTNLATISNYIVSLSRLSATVGGTIDEADQAHSNCNAINQSHITANGFQVWATGSGTFTSCNVAGNWTINH